MTDFLCMDKIAEIIKKQQLPRLLYRKGVCAEGNFISYMNLSDYTKASFLSNTEEETPVTVRFAKVFAQEGAADTKRDVTGFFTRFFTKEGRFDLLAHNMQIPKELKNPENIIRLAEAFKKREEELNIDDRALWKLAADNYDFIPFFINFFSDNGTVKSYRHIEGYSFNDYTFINESGERRSVSLQWCPAQGCKNISRQEAEFLAGFDGNAAIRDLNDAISEGRYPQYNLILYPEEGEALTIGRLKLTAIAESCAAEEIAYTPANTVNGIELTDTGFNRFISFAFNESARARGGRR